MTPEHLAPAHHPHLAGTLCRLYESIRRIRRIIDDILPPDHPRRSSLLNETQACMLILNDVRAQSLCPDPPPGEGKL